MSATPPIVLRAEALGKRYELGGESGSGMLREAVMALPRLLLGASSRAPVRRALWALRGCSFEVRQGEVLGIVGPNGAGKSTLLKIVARITRPTEGFVEVAGRVGSLLEVGTGFHPELSGRENVLLSGVMLGMTRREVLARFGEIVEFSGIDAGFLDTPVKRYSSGMQMRLAFAVAAHLEPEILIVDEVLAVGDAEFQRRCLGRMGQAARSGRTVLFVSHNLAAIRNLCPEAMVLGGGQVQYKGPTEEAIRRYLAAVSSAPPTGEADVGLEVEHSRLISWAFAQADGSAPRPLCPARLTFRVQAKRELFRPSLMFQVYSNDGSLLFSLDFQDLAEVGRVGSSEVVQFVFDLPALPLIPGEYPLQVSLKNLGNGEIGSVQRLLKLEVGDGPVYREHSAETLRRWYGPVAVGGVRASFTVGP